MFMPVVNYWICFAARCSLCLLFPTKRLKSNHGSVGGSDRAAAVGFTQSLSDA